MNTKSEFIYSNLNDTFHIEDAILIASKINVPESTARRIISNLVTDKKIKVNKNNKKYLYTKKDIKMQIIEYKDYTIYMYKTNSKAKLQELIKLI